MPKVFYAPASPYSTKVRMAAHYAGFPVEAVQIDTNLEPEELINVNPLGKIPTLILDDGSAIFDSRVITQYINRVSGNKLFPRNAQKRLEAEQLESLADGLCDALLAHVYERRFRPEEKVHQPWLDRQWGKALRVLDTLNNAPPRLGKKIHGGHIAIAAALAYADLRFQGKWEKGRSKLKRWQKRFAELHPELAALLPK
ncbi:glutathione S-transferase [Phyllobacterium sp. 0TCS1.6C]|uniref:glutathione S-transferase n=1 Tax=unclassified Phyllobacterium TaxID=2638441 RepID=UPI002263EE0C|nr:MULTISPECIES: glutathione S-transferase [unclassified Phyllobacterium]MCX8280470.1 glutathione S-transferase [Phyllobacterium sp. 0TCS1.6C]MCX8295081.1 glutathione S-transferase [Phyllobacterium sp. 0TCS1.6A]